MPNLYAINEDMQTLLANGFDEDCIDLETGEINDVLLGERLMKLELTEHDKIENIALFVKELESDIGAIKAEESNLKQRRGTKEKKSEWLKSYLSSYLTLTERTKFETPKCALTFRKSESVNIFDEHAFVVGGKYFDTETVYKFDKTGIKKAIKSGEDLIGAEVVTKQNLQVK